MACRPAEIKVDPLRLHFQVSEGWAFIPPYQYITIDRASSDMSSMWSIAGGAFWLTCGPTMGRTRSRVQVGCKSIGMVAGSYETTLTVRNDSIPEQEPITVEIVLDITPKEQPPEPEPDPEHTPMPKPEPEPQPLPEPDPYPDTPEDPYVPDTRPWLFIFLEWLIEQIKKILR